MKHFVNPSFKEVSGFINDERVKKDIANQVTQVLENVKDNGDKALYEYTLKFDGVDLKDNNFIVDKDEISRAVSKVDPELIEALEAAKRNIVRYHDHQKRPNWQFELGYDSYIRELSIPVENVGIYIPGGTAPLVSSVLMTVLPAKVAGVKKVVVSTPPQKDGSVHDGILAACALCDVDAVYRVGGAQAVAAMAYGTETIPKVNVIAGPGNQYVTEAKRQLFGVVGIDMIAGPSEILILTDKTANPEYVAIDLLSQLEHGKDSKGVCISTDKEFLKKLKKAIIFENKKLKRQDILEVSVEKGILLIEVPDINRMVELADKIGPEHLEIMMENARLISEKIKNAGVVFIGEYTPEAVGDYIAGPSHVLPTGGNAQVFYGLSVYHFVKKVSHIYYSKSKLEKEYKHIQAIAVAEGLDAHCASVSKRCEE